MANLNKKSTKKGPKDFEKTKVKVGRAKAGAVNATDTSFQSKRLCLREQHLSTAQKIEAYAGESLTALGATLKPTISQTGHYNVNMRKEAFVTLLKRCKEQPDISQVLNILLETASRGMVDKEAPVRSAVLSLTTFIWERKLELRALFGGWVQFALLAMTHLHEDIRRDSLKFLDSAIRLVPDLVIPYTGKILVALSDGSMQGKIKRGSAITRECALCLMDLYTKARSAPLDTPSLAYCWQPIQKQALFNLRIRKAPAVDQIIDEMTLSEYTKVITWLSESLLDDWLEAAPIVVNPSMPRDAKSTEKQAYNRFTLAMKRLISFTLASGYDSDSFVQLLPSPIRNSLYLKSFL
jgi:hypothetical protein